MGKIIFFEERNFEGRSYETSSDCSDLTSAISCCNSCRVLSGCFMVYELPDYMGQQMMIRRGDYPDNPRLGGLSMNECIRSCRIIPMHQGVFRMRIFEREHFKGPMHELMDDCDCIQECFLISNCQSCNVTHGHWLMYEKSNYRGRMIYVKPGVYSTFGDMGLGPMMFESIRRIMESC